MGITYDPRTGIRRVDGLTDMGPVRVPPLPQWIVMRDRVLGVDYVLTHSGNVGNLEIATSLTLPTTPDVARYGPYDGPYLSPGTWRLFLAGGELNLEQSAIPHGNQRVLARSGLTRTFLEVLVNDAGTLIYEELTV
jgi:hypothetical protein